MLFLLPWTTEKSSGNYARLRFVSRQEYLSPCCFGTFSISSFLFHFVLSENIPHKMSTLLPEKWQTLVLCNGNTSLALNCLRIQCPDYTKCNTKTGTRAVRGHDTYTYATENPELGLFQTGKQTNCKTCLEVFTIIFFSLNFSIFIC